MPSKKDKKAQERLDTWHREAEIARFADSIRRNPQLMHSRKRRQDRYDKWRQEDEQRMEEERRQAQDTRDSLSDRETRLLTSLRLLTKYGPNAEAQARKIENAMAMSRVHAIKTGAMPATDMPEYETPPPLPQMAGPVNQEHSSARSSSSDDDDDDETGAGIKHTRSHQSLRSRHRRRMKRPRPNRFATKKKLRRKIKSKKTYKRHRPRKHKSKKKHH